MPEQAEGLASVLSGSHLDGCCSRRLRPSRVACSKALGAQELLLLPFPISSWETEAWTSILTYHCIPEVRRPLGWKKPARREPTGPALEAAGVRERGRLAEEREKEGARNPKTCTPERQLPPCRKHCRVPPPATRQERGESFGKVSSLSPGVTVTTVHRSLGQTAPSRLRRCTCSVQPERGEACAVADADTGTRGRRAGQG